LSSRSRPQCHCGSHCADRVTTPGVLRMSESCDVMGCVVLPTRPAPKRLIREVSTLSVNSLGHMVKPPATRFRSASDELRVMLSELKYGVTNERGARVIPQCVCDAEVTVTLRGNDLCDLMLANMSRFLKELSPVLEMYVKNSRDWRFLFFRACFKLLRSPASDTIGRCKMLRAEAMLSDDDRDVMMRFVNLLVEHQVLFLHALLDLQRDMSAKEKLLDRVGNGRDTFRHGVENVCRLRSS